MNYVGQILVLAPSDGLAECNPPTRNASRQLRKKRIGLRVSTELCSTISCTKGTEFHSKSEQKINKINGIITKGKNFTFKALKLKGTSKKNFFLLRLMEMGRKKLNKFEYTD